MNRTTLIAIAAAIAAGAAAAFAWSRRGRRTGGATGGGAASEWTCACGQQFRVSGTGRHRVLWLKDAAADDPVVGDRCPACDRALPDAA